MRSICLIVRLVHSWVVYEEDWFNNFLSVTKLEGVKDMDYRGRQNYDRGPREMHKATCSDCGEECEVPFKPTEGRPVYCLECYTQHRPPRRY